MAWYANPSSPTSSSPTSTFALASRGNICTYEARLVVIRVLHACSYEYPHRLATYTATMAHEHAHAMSKTIVPPRSRLSANTKAIMPFISKPPNTTYANGPTCNGASASP